MAFARQILLPREGEHIGSGFQAPETHSKAAGPRNQRQPSPPLPDGGGAGAGCETAFIAFLSKGAVGLVCAARRAFQVPLQTAAPRSSVGAVGETGPRGALSSWTRGALQVPGRRMPSHAQSCFPKKENTLGVGFRLRRTPTNQQGPGSQRQPSPALPDVQWRAGCLNGLRAFLS